jgi:O-antigen ligase
MQFIINNFLLLIGIQVGMGFEINPMIIAGNVGYFDPLVIIVLFLCSTRGLSRGISFLAGLVLALVIWMTLSNLGALLSGQPNGSALPALRAVWYLLFITMISALNRIEILRLLMGICLGTLFYAFYSIFLHFQSPVNYWGIPAIARGDNNGNTLGYFMSFGIISIIFIWKSINDSPVLKLILAVAFFTLSCVGFLTLSKTFWIFLIVLLGSLVLFIKGSFIIILALPLLTVAWFFASPAVLGRLEGSDGSNTQRLEMLLAGLRMIADAPVFGMGHQAFFEFGSNYGRWESDVHNVFVGVGLEYGVLGIIIFTFIYFILPLIAYLKMRSFTLNQTNWLIPVTLGTGILWGLTCGLPLSDRLYITLVCSFIFFNTPKVLLSRESIQMTSRNRLLA